MATLPAANYLSNAARSEGEAKVALEDQLAAIKQIPGAGVAETTLTIASGSITPPSGGPGIFKVDTEAGAATDDLTNIIQTNIPDGSVIWIRAANAARVPTIRTSAGGAGQITMQGSQDLALTNILQWVCLKRTGTLWEVMVSPVLISPVLDAGTVTIDPTAALGIVSKQYADQHGFTTGDVKLTLKTVADTSWVLMDDRTIGNASSGATGRANADTAALFALLWANITNQWAPVSTGRGASAAADYAANKTLKLPKTLGRALAGYGTGTTSQSGVDVDVDITNNQLGVDANNSTWIGGMLVLFTLTSGTITGLTSGAGYFIIRISSTLVKLANSLANAQNGIAIDFTAKSSPVWTITHTDTARVLGEHVGESTHATSVTEALAHDHRLQSTSGVTDTSISTATGLAGWNNGATGFVSGTTDLMESTGGNVAMNNMQPSVFMNVMIKL